MESNLQRLEETFRRMEADGFDSTRPLLSGFYFIANNKTALEKVWEELSGHNYKLTYLKKSNLNVWQLKVVKEDILTPGKLHKRNLSFNELADYCEAEVYDGWDVEKINTY